jgi:acetoin utilization deacetylase AcuC-like enzyme
MHVFFSANHLHHQPRHEFTGGALIPAFDSPERAETIVQALRDHGGFHVRAPQDHGIDPIRAVHREDYIAFLKTVFSDWKTAGLIGSPMASNVASTPKGHVPIHIEGRIGYFANASDTTIDQGTWTAAYASAQSAISAAHHVASGKANTGFALCRPPGHHCEADRFGGYCYLNNAAIAAQVLRDCGAERVAVLDLDFHHGNGTQAIFWDRADVFFGSVHGDPRHCYPFFTGHADERGGARGTNATLNIPLPPGTNAAEWLRAITQLLDAAHRFNADTLVVSLGVDPHRDDPQSFFELDHHAFNAAGALLRDAALPCVVVLEGGYCAQALAPCVLGFLTALSPNRKSKARP